MKKLRMALVTGLLVAAPAVTALAQEETFDGQTLADQPIQTQMLFENTWGMNAEAQWAAEHNDELMSAGVVDPMNNEEQSGAQLSVSEQRQDGVSVDDEANPGFGATDDDDDDDDGEE